MSQLPKDEKLAALLAAIKDCIGEDIGFVAFFKMNGKEITHVSPLFKEPQSIQHMVQTMLEASKALKWTAEDMINRTLNKN